MESANVVGYQANNVAAGWSIVTPCFENVDGEPYAIDKFTVNGVSDGDATVQSMNADGSWGTMGVWLNEFVDGDTVYPAGWFTDISGVTPADITLKPGAAVMFSTTATGASTQSAGQVPATIAHDIITGWSMIGNASCATISIDEITLEGVADGDATVQVMNPDGSWGTMGVWLNEVVDGDTVYPAGWFTDISGATAAEITLTPGQSVMFSTTAIGAKAFIPSALK